MQAMSISSNDMSISYLYSDYENAIKVGRMQHLVVREEITQPNPSPIIFIDV